MMVAERAGDAHEFEAHRSYLTGLAYRMLGSLAEAEDAVQESYLRWHSADRVAVDNPRAFLSRIVTRICLDHLKSARAQREHYVGPWLPEPVVDDEALRPGTGSEYADDLSVALMLALERLSPLERAAFLLHDVFDVEFAQVASILDRSEAACRQLAARARTHVKESRPRFEAAPEDAERLASAFLIAARTGDAATLTRLLAEDAVLRSDGGGKRLAALRPIFGRDKITRFFVGIAKKIQSPEGYRFAPARINGVPGFLITEPNGSVQTIAVETRDGLVTAVYIVANPDKVRHLAGP